MTITEKHPSGLPLGQGMHPPKAIRRTKHWGVNGVHPTQVHETLEAARESAQRQAALKPGALVVIYEAIESYEIPLAAAQRTKL